MKMINHLPNNENFSRLKQIVTPFVTITVVVVVVSFNLSECYCASEDWSSGTSFY